jgi:putative SOS response-associated peptidase YedK
MCYSNSSISSALELSKRYMRKIPDKLHIEPTYYALGFTFPQWPVITRTPELTSMQWGLIPYWFKGNPIAIASKTLNARCETILEKASFKHTIFHHHCLIPSSGFYEWKMVGKDKIPYYIYPQQDKIMSLAGIYDNWVNEDTGEVVSSFSILTCEANPMMARIHNSKKRMPLIIPKEKEEEWLHVDKYEQLPLLFHPLADDYLRAHRVNKHMLQGDNPNRPEVVQKYSDNQYMQGNLF